MRSSAHSIAGPLLQGAGLRINQPLTLTLTPTLTLTLTLTIVQMYDFATGSLLCTFLFDFPPMAVQLHPSTDWIIVGGKTGVVAMIPLFLPVSALD